MMRRFTAVAILGLASAGCGESTTSSQPNPATPPSTTAQAPAAPPVAPPPVAPPATQAPATSETQAPATSETPSAADPLAPAPGTERVEAKAGVGAQGRDYAPGFVTTPIAAYFSAQQRIQFDQLKHALNLFRASNDRHPTDDEFWKIVEENGLNLPTLPAGERYVYDEKTGELMVERPQQ